MVFLCIDTATARTQVGLFDGVSHRWVAFRWDFTPTVECMDLLIQRTLEDGKLALNDLEGIAACAGPGGLLGLRMAKISVDVWRILTAKVPIFSYNALHLVAEDLLLQKKENFALYAQINREKFYVLRVKKGNFSPIALENFQICEMEYYFLPINGDKNNAQRLPKLISYDLKFMGVALAKSMVQLSFWEEFRLCVILNDFSGSA
jgi:tRNA A37 threonylcarbamoyladenosine modification protein TsaB